MNDVEAVADEGTLYGEMQSDSFDGLAGLFDCFAPSAASTIDSREEVRDCDEWGLFSETNQREVSEDEDVVDDTSDEDIDPVVSKCIGTDFRLTPVQLGIESGFVLGRSRQDDTDRQDFDPAAEEEIPVSRTESSANTSTRRRIQVLVRVRPPLEVQDKIVVTVGETAGTSLCVQATSAQGSISTVTECTFDRVFMEAATQEDVFAAVEPSVQAFLDGYNATVFAYGQTGTGKTHTLFGPDLGVFNDRNTCDGAVEHEDDPLRSVKSYWGIVPRTLSYLFDQAAILKQEGCQVELHLSFLQIYNERLFDLLTDRMRQKPLLIREQPTLDGSTSVNVQGLSSERLSSFSNAMRIIHQGHINRCVRETEFNSTSSRSHAIVQLYVTMQCPAANGDGQVVRKARLNLVDLAGSEKWNTDVEMDDSHSQELKNINASLSALGNCIAALTETGRKHIPYRDSALTRVLQDSLGGNTQSCLIATVNATQHYCDETIRTLQFADRARSVMQTTRVNEVTEGSTELLMAKLQITKLRGRLQREQRRRHETRLKEQQTMQRDFQEKLKGKDKEIMKLMRDNVVFQKWRDEDVQKIRQLESRVKDLERQIDFNENKNTEALADVAATPVQLRRRQHSTLGIQKTRSRTNFVGVACENSMAAKTYKEVVERYTLGSNKEQQPEAILNIKDPVDQTGEINSTNQLEDQPPGLNTSSLTKYKTHCEAASQECDVRPTVWGSPVICSPNAKDIAAVVSSSTKNSWIHSNIVPSKASFNSKSGLSKSTPAMLTQKQENNHKRHDPWSPNSTTTSTLNQEPTSTTGSRNYGVLQRSLNTRSIIEPCQKHKLTGCMLCSVNESFQSTSASTCPMKETRKTQDGPCERHQLLRCFICSKSGVSSSSDVQVTTKPLTLTSASSTCSYNTAVSAVRTSNFSYQSVSLPSEAQSKCALHALANCILCAGVKAMTRKVAVPTPHASPAKAVAVMFNTRNGEPHAADRYRRYTLDERILNYKTQAKQLMNER